MVDTHTHLKARQSFKLDATHTHTHASIHQSHRRISILEMYLKGRGTKPDRVRMSRKEV